VPHIHFRVPVGLLLQFVCSTAALAQTATPCSYDACALRLRHTFWKTQIVQGQKDSPVASVGLFPPAVPLFAERSDSAARYYASFRRRATSSAVLGLAGLAAITVGLLVEGDDHDAGLVLVIGGGLLGTVGGILRTGAQERLSRAVWWYNRSLASP
jgi:hypothetical protein